MSTVHLSSTTAPVNIAVVKYWGKRDPTLNLPTNSSISVTLSQDDLRAWTTASCSQDFPEDRMWLNGEERSTTDDKRLLACLKELRSLRTRVEQEDGTLPKLSGMGLHIASENNFPTAAGLASSAAGFAALVRAVADLYKLPSSRTELSRIARQGSGSACRSLFGGYVAWEMGTREDGSDSQAVQVAEADHWPTMKACILVASAQKKDVSSTSGMQSTTKTSLLFRERIERVVPDRMARMTEAIRARDFSTFAELTMRDSNGFHAVCLDTYPPIFYMNDVSRAVVRLVEHINGQAGETVCAYTYDAGPNTVIYYLRENEARVLSFVKGAVSATTRGADGLSEQTAASVPDVLAQTISAGVSRVILTKIGGGPEKTERSVLGPDGFPRK
ncbi:Diphosphomevalonate decarboxylase [Taphrina deformans PYCC 5710]|uniref:Diphosphomevalonate decarboxylase n=1 Tax=Taphrina deformans (strain PYCC 5710 / ATCC 11124 / CBS 356.35 / IMI 108563 / JCM 9778 / NBRC 8474) TaxID=1097556 RepID=R4XIT3_TAPDE|nr:Diphosphomevalonate decarboxylase [Taphrina deformans PYCC 5710]|eukprot:CCG83278.1 Diphosphomevalonate decarboxylase [Taphrina deformans PYCC 5710]